MKTEKTDKTVDLIRSTCDDLLSKHVDSFALKRIEEAKESYFKIEARHVQYQKDNPGVKMPLKLKDDLRNSWQNYLDIKALKDCCEWAKELSNLYNNFINVNVLTLKGKYEILDDICGCARGFMACRDRRFKPVKVLYREIRDDIKKEKDRLDFEIMRIENCIFESIQVENHDDALEALESIHYAISNSIDYANCYYERFAGDDQHAMAVALLKEMRTGMWSSIRGQDFTFFDRLVSEMDSSIVNLDVDELYYEFKNFKGVCDYIAKHYNAFIIYLKKTIANLGLSLDDFVCVEYVAAHWHYPPAPFYLVMKTDCFQIGKDEEHLTRYDSAVAVRVQ